MVQRNAVTSKRCDNVEHAAAGFNKGLNLRDLTAHMAVNAGNADIGQALGAAVESKRFLVGHAELVVL